MNPLNAREWLEGIVRTGAQRSGFAQDMIDRLDMLERDLMGVVELLQDAGVVERGTVPEDLVGLLAMFVHG